MDPKKLEAYVYWINLIPASLAMGAMWGSLMLTFWGAASGPMKPFSYPAIDTAPSLMGFVFWFSMSFVPCFFPKSYYHPKVWEINGRFYEGLGVSIFARFVPHGDIINRLIRRRDPNYRVLKNRSALPQRVKSTCQGEKGHLVLFLMGLFTTIYACRIGWYGWAVGLAFGNCIANLYPLLLQRYIRNRIYRFNPTANTEGREA